MKQSGVIILAAVSALAAGMLAKNFLSSLGVPAPLPAFSLPDLAGKPHNITEWQGKILIINFWASWCPPCRKEIPEFINLQEEFAAKNVVFIGIAIDEQQAVTEYLKAMQINYPQLIAGTEGIALSQQLGDSLNAVPFTIVVNRQGQIIHRQPGEFSRAKFLEIITPLLKT